MKINKIILTILILSTIALIFPGCGGGGTTPPINHSPTIASLTANPQSPIEINQNTVITCSASDSDGDPLAYTWTKTGGTITGTGSAITWIAPDIEGTYIITCIVSDGEITDEQSISIDVGQGSTTPEPELIEIASGEIDLNEGGVVEVTDPNSELYGLKLTIEPQKNIRENKEDPIWIAIQFFLNPDVAKWPLPDDQGFLITPTIIKVESIDAIFAKLEISYHKEQLINAGVANNAPIKVFRVPFSALFFLPWIELPSNKYTVENNIVNITMGEGDLGYTYTLTVKNTATQNPSKNPQPGDLLYKSSSWGMNEGWLTGHVGIYVGEKYDEKEEKPYNVIEALLGGVKRSYYPDISSFGGDSLYLGAREIKGLSHLQRNEIIEFVDDKKVIGKPYALFQTLGTILGLGLGKGVWVKGPEKFNCVGLAEAAYESAGIDIVTDHDEGNVGELVPYHILTPAEQWYKTVPASGVLIQNIPPKISNLKVIPEGSINMNSSVFITCNATDQDKDNLTYIWTIPEYGNFITFTKGKSISWAAPDEKGDYKISCRVIDNYGGEDSEQVIISVGEVNHAPVITSTPVTSATKDEPYSYDVNATDSDGDTLVYSLTTKPTGMTINSTTGLIAWTPTTSGDYNVTVKVSDGEFFATQSFTITVSESNHPPVISSLTANPSGIDINQTTTITCAASDPDGNSLTYSWTKNGGTFEGNTSGSSVTWRAPSTEGNYTVECEVSDGEASDSESVNISVGNVNHAPVITSTPVTSATKDEPYSYDVNATDSDGDTLVYSLTTKPTGMTINSATGLINWTPIAAQIGDNAVTIEVSDGELSSSQSFTITVGVEGDYIVEFEDYNLEQVVRETINKPSGPLYLSDVIGIRTLDAERRGIESLNGIQHLQNLQQLYLAHNQVSDISALQTLTNLQILYFNYNQVSDISALQNLTNLTSLVFGDNQVSDISALQNLTNLWWLKFWQNQVSDISALQNLTKLQSLDFRYNQVSDISVLQNLTNLQGLSFDNNQVSDISALENLTNLLALDFEGNQVSDISVLENLPNLHNLYFAHNQVSDISVLQNLTNLQGLSFDNNQVSDISALSNLTNLDRLWYGNNQVSDISVLQNLTNLQELLFYNNQVSDISALENLTNLHDLDFKGNQVSDISALVENEGFGPGDKIVMRYNSLDLTEGSQNRKDIDTLISRGVGVYY